MKRRGKCLTKVWSILLAWKSMKYSTVQALSIYCMVCHMVTLKPQLQLCVYFQTALNFGWSSPKDTLNHAMMTGPQQQ